MYNQHAFSDNFLGSLQHFAASAYPAITSMYICVRKCVCSRGRKTHPSKVSDGSGTWDMNVFVPRTSVQSGLEN